MNSWEIELGDKAVFWGRPRVRKSVVTNLETARLEVGALIEIINQNNGLFRVRDLSNQVIYESIDASEMRAIAEVTAERLAGPANLVYCLDYAHYTAASLCQSCLLKDNWRSYKPQSEKSTANYCAGCGRHA